MTDHQHAAAMLRVKLARAEFERTARDARIQEACRSGSWDRRLDGTTRVGVARGLRDLAGDELALALEAACE